MRKIKKIFSLIIPVLVTTSLVIFIAGCEGQETAKLEELKAISRRSIEDIWNAGNTDAVDDIYAADFVYHIVGSPEIHGTEGFKQFVTMYLTAFPDLQFTIDDQIAEGDKVVTRWTATGTHNGELMGISPTGKSSTVMGISISRVAGGKIEEGWVNWDILGMLQQLGVIPPMGKGEE